LQCDQIPHHITKQDESPFWRLKEEAVGRTASFP
jgi:hypothetical protein